MDEPQPNPMLAHIDDTGALVALVFDDSGLSEDHSVVPLPDDYWSRPYRWTGEAFEADIAGARAALWEATKAKRFAVELGGCPTPLGRMDSDTVSQAKLNGAVTMALIAQAAAAPFSVDWTMADNSTVSHDGPAIIAAGMAMGAFVAEAHAVAIALRGTVDTPGTIEGAGSFADIDAIDIEAAPWPEQAKP